MEEEEEPVPAAASCRLLLLLWQFRPCGEQERLERISLSSRRRRGLSAAACAEFWVRGDGH
jgi:hypothetical protein